MFSLTLFVIYIEIVVKRFFTDNRQLTAGLATFRPAVE